MSTTIKQTKIVIVACLFMTLAFGAALFHGRGKAQQATDALFILEKQILESDPIDSVYWMVQQAVSTNKGLSVARSDGLLVVSTPLQWGAKNLVLTVLYTNGVVEGSFIATADDPYSRHILKVKK